MTLYLLECSLNQITVGNSRELIGFTMPLNWLGNPAQVKLRFDWQSYQQGCDFCRSFNTYGWRSYPIWDDEPRKQEPKQFVMLKSMEVLSWDVSELRTQEATKRVGHFSPAILLC